MSRSALVLCLLAAVCGAAQPSRLRRPTPDLGDVRIVGGEPVDISQFPWQVSLEDVWLDCHFCGGSIIGPTWVLTAAYCIEIYYPQWLYVRAGSSYRESGGYVYNVTRIIVHEGYDHVNWDYDFGLLEISEPIAFGSNVQPVILGTSEIDGGTMVNVTGWGHTSVLGDQPEQLHAVTMPIIDRDTCKAVYAVLNRNVTEHMICAGEEEGGMGACMADSGGPLVEGNTQYGVVSWGYGCAEPGYPGVYANVPAVRSWITEKTSL